MRLLDLFCGGGGAAAGYHRAGFNEIVGVDIRKQKHYPYKFVQADAFDYLKNTDLSQFDMIHASPPCQAYSALAIFSTNGYGRLINTTRDALNETGLPYVIENIMSAGFSLNHPLMLCGSMFGLGIERGYLKQHRLFETTFLVQSYLKCKHKGQGISIYGHGGKVGLDHATYWNIKEARALMGISWLTNDEIREAIPPAFTEFIGKNARRAIIAQRLNQN